MLPAHILAEKAETQPSPHLYSRPVGFAAKRKQHNRDMDVCSLDRHQQRSSSALLLASQATCRREGGTEGYNWVFYMQPKTETTRAKFQPVSDHTMTRHLWSVSSFYHRDGICNCNFAQRWQYRGILLIGHWIMNDSLYWHCCCGPLNNLSTRGGTIPPHKKGIVNRDSSGIVPLLLSTLIKFPPLPLTCASSSTHRLSGFLCTHSGQVKLHWPKFVLVNPLSFSIRNHRNEWLTRRRGIES